MAACTFTTDLDGLSAGGASSGAGGTTNVGGEGGDLGQGGVGNTGGTPEPPTCDSPVQCEPPNTKCQVPACIGGECGQAAVVMGQEVVGEQVPGDCAAIVCDGGGTKIKTEDPTDLPDDLNPCTSDSCNGEMPQHDDVQDGTVCGDMLSCVTGLCVGCTTASQCPDADTVCATPTCSMVAVCGFNYLPNGTPLPDPDQAPGDCQQIVCNGMGLEQSVDDPTDLPPDDGNPCTQAACIAGSPAQVPLAAGEPCSEGGVVCDGFGACTQCIADGDQNHQEVGVDCGGPLCEIGCPNATPCTNAGDCDSGFCSDGVCCSSACTMQCRSCNGALSGGPGGNCKIVIDGLNPDGECGPDGTCVNGNCLMIFEP